MSCWLEGRAGDAQQARKDPAENLQSLPSWSLKHQEGRMAFQPGCYRLIAARGAQSSCQQPVNATLRVKRGFMGIIKSRVFTQSGDPRPSRWVRYNHRDPCKREAGGERKWGVLTEAGS